MKTGGTVSCSNVCMELFSHNQLAYDAVCRFLKKEGKAAVIHPTGTGKSFIAFRLVLDNLDAEFLWLSPSEYIFRMQIENLKENLTGTEQEKEAFLNAFKEKLHFMTYARLMLCPDAVLKWNLDYIILDEFHRCGAAEWGKGMGRLLRAYPYAKLLGLSATSVRYLDNRRDMAEELFNNYVASRMTLGEAVASGILPAPVYVVSMYSYKEEMERLQRLVNDSRDRALQKRNVELLEKLRRSLEQADGLETVFDRHMKNRQGKYIVFCAGKKHMEEMVSHMTGWLRFIDREPRIYKVSCDESGARKQFWDFKEDRSSHLKLLFCIDMLNEGVHVGELDGVILLRPTVSPALYMQQIGRCLAAGRGQEKHPVIFDIVNNFESLISVDGLCKEIQEAAVQLSYVGNTGKYSEVFRVIDVLKDCRKLFDELNRNLSLPWEAYYQEAEAYYKREGHLEIKKRYVTENGFNLGAWIQSQRRIYAGTVAGTLSIEQIKRLNAIGMRWQDKKTEQFERGIEELILFVKQNGHGDTGSYYETENGFPLGKWLSNMRSKYKKGNLRETEVKIMEQAGMIWDVNRYRWEEYCMAAEKYRKQFGNLDIPCHYVTEDGQKLGIWLNNQKSSYAGRENKQCSLEEEQIQRLEALGISWEGKFESSWDRKYQLAKEYYIKNGHLEMPSTYVYKGENLGKWLNEIRLSRNKTDFSRYALTEEKIRRLDAIGMVWKKEDSWEYRYSLSEKYYREYGDLDVSQQYRTDEGIWLGKWIYMQRMQYKNGTLEIWKKERLDQIGMVWDSQTERAFERGYQALTEYLAQNKEKKIAKNYTMPDGYHLGNWVYRQKRKKKEGKLTGEQAEKLEILEYV